MDTVYLEFSGVKRSAKKPVITKAVARFAAASPQASLTLQVDPMDVWNLHRETHRLLEKYILSVQEGKMVDEASRFARWLTFSGVFNLVDAYARSCPGSGPFAVDAAAFRALAASLIQHCSPHSQGSRPAPTISQESLLTLHEKMDGIQQQVLQVMSAVGSVAAPDYFLPKSKFETPRKAMPVRPRRAAARPSRLV